MGRVEGRGDIGSGSGVSCCVGEDGSVLGVCEGGWEDECVRAGMRWECEGGCSVRVVLEDAPGVMRDCECEVLEG